MSEVDIIDLCRRSLLLILVVSAPTVGAAIVVGIAISLIQAMTQVQEATLTFVPKIIATLLVLYVAMPYMASAISSFSSEIFSFIGR